jgi:hypothetical protein
VRVSRAARQFGMADRCRCTICQSEPRFAITYVKRPGLLTGVPSRTLVWVSKPVTTTTVSETTMTEWSPSFAPRGLLGFPIVFAKFWGLSSAEESAQRRDPQPLSETFVHNELMRRCLLRWQSESITHGVSILSPMFARCRIKRTFSDTSELVVKQGVIP